MKRGTFKKPTPEKVKELNERKRVRQSAKIQATRGHRMPQDKRNTPKRKQTRATAKRRKKGQWSTGTADGYFSRWVRERDGACRRCSRTDQLTCSHYHKRAISITRFDPLNCIALCGECHALWEGPKKEYTELMIAWLGTDGFIELQKKQAP